MNHPPRSHADLSLTRHPPEHGKADAPDILPAGCCCCCCCCLHTMGSIGGSIIGSAARIETAPVRNTDPDAPFPYRLDVFEEDQPLISPVLLYWMMVLLTVLGSTALAPLLFGGPRPSADPASYLAIGLFTSVMILPGLQLLASLLCVFFIAVFYPERSYAMRRVGRITLWSFGGTMIGMLLMGGCLAVLMLANK